LLKSHVVSPVQNPASETQASALADSPRNESSQAAIEVKGLEMAYGSYVLMRDISFSVAPAEIMIIMGGSGCGKSTLLKYLIGLKEVEKG
jgi:phospholipid/cholesterol/gamma-HCH transport system ATP-binding protein